MVQFIVEVIGGFIVDVIWSALLWLVAKVCDVLFGWMVEGMRVTGGWMARCISPSSGGRRGIVREGMRVTGRWMGRGCKVVSNVLASALRFIFPGRGEA